jgi:hypothetical protein
MRSVTARLGLASAAATSFTSHPSKAGRGKKLHCVNSWFMHLAPTLPADLLFDVAKGREQREGNGSVSNQVRWGRMLSLSFARSLSGSDLVVPSMDMVAARWALHLEGLHHVASSIHATGVILLSFFLSLHGHAAKPTCSYH